VQQAYLRLFDLPRADHGGALGGELRLVRLEAAEDEPQAGLDARAEPRNVPAV
jgi:hypothetical protein